jgi:DNA-binding IclR family transcriptional regulator
VDTSDHDAHGRPRWTFLTNHGHVMVCIAQRPDVRLSEIAALVGIGERAAHRIVQDLVDARYVTRRKVGRRNVYEVDLDRPLRHPLEAHQVLRTIMEPIVDTADDATTGRPA